MSKNKRRSTDKLYEKLKDIFVQNYLKTKNTMIFELSAGKYEFFGKYRVEEGEHITVHRYRDDAVFQFSKLRIAAAWVTIDNKDRFEMSKRMVALDAKAGALDVEISHHKELISKNPQLDRLLVYQAKLGKELFERKQIQMELDKYITTAKLWQLKEIENATKRNQPK